MANFENSENNPGQNKNFHKFISRPSKIHIFWSGTIPDYIAFKTATPSQNELNQDRRSLFHLC